jgi:leader peptidase (prepilin peptidase)/N-methyltransferase
MRGDTGASPVLGCNGVEGNELRRPCENREPGHIVGVLVIAAAVTSHQLSIARTRAAAATVGLAYLALALLTPASVGMGDVRLAALSGLLLGTHGWGTVLIGAVLPHLLAAAAVTVLQLTGRRAHRQTEIPFGPCLVTGAVLAPSVHAAAA